MVDRVAAAEQAVRKRMDAIGVAYEDVQPKPFGTLTAGQLAQDPKISIRYQNRLMTLLLLISHLRDDARRLAKRKGLKNKVVDEFVGSSTVVELCVRAGDTRKHGLGGRGKNATIADGLISVQKTKPGESRKPTDQAIIIGMALVDAELGLFHSQVVVERAIREWVRFLGETLEVSVDEEVRAWLPEHPPIHTHVRAGVHGVVPLGSLVTMEFPPDMVSKLVDDVRKRSENA